jgi:polysaccharide biosynthesis protein PslH
MNILILSPFLPYPLDQGGKIRVFNLVKYLSCSNRITLACLTPGAAPDMGPLHGFCEEIVTVERNASFARDFSRFLFNGEAFNCARFSSSSFTRQLSVLAARKSFDLIQIEFSLLWQYADLFPGIPVVLDAHNIEYRNVQQIGEGCKGLGKRLLYRLEASRLQAVEEGAWRECALCFTVSKKERDEIASSTGNCGKVVAAANGVDPERFAFRPRGNSGTKILFLGGMDYSPNLDAAKYFLTEVFPIIRREEPEARVLLVGRELGKLGELALLPGVECHESVPEVLPWFYEADLLVVPLRQGAGTRIKVLEAMAAGLPVVATSKGCEGIAAESGRELLIADTPKEFAAAALSIMHSPEVRANLARNAHRLVVERYTWESAAKIMDQSYQRT